MRAEKCAFKPLYMVQPQAAAVNLGEYTGRGQQCAGSDRTGTPWWPRSQGKEGQWGGEAAHLGL